MVSCSSRPCDAPSRSPNLKQCASAPRERSVKITWTRADDHVTLLVFHMRLMVLRTPVLRILLKRNRDNSRQRPKRINIFLFLTTAQTKTVQQNMTVERLLHRVASCRSAADDANLFSCPHEDCTQPAKQTVERRVIPNSIIVILPWRNDISNFFTSPFGL